MACDVEQLLEDACASGIAALDERRLWMISAQMACGGVTPPPETFFRISQTGDVRISDVADARVYQ